MAQKVLWQEMLPEEFLAARDGFPVCWMAYGLAEPHGAYNALGLDWLKAEALVERAAEETGGIVAPPLCWHIQERSEFADDGRGHGWLCEAGVRQSLASSLPANVFYQMVFHQIRAFDARGFHGVVLVTGHYGGPEVFLRLICDYYLRRTGSPIRLCALADWECIDPASRYRGDHAGICETSQLMALRPGLTDLGRRAIGPAAAAELGEQYAGYVDFSADVLPTPEIGRNIVESQVRNLADIGRQLVADYRPVERWKAPNPNEVDAIWHRFQLATRRYWTTTYREFREKTDLVFPGWEELGE